MIQLTNPNRQITPSCPFRVLNHAGLRENERRTYYEMPILIRLHPGNCRSEIWLSERRRVLVPGFTRPGFYMGNLGFDKMKKQIHREV